MMGSPMYELPEHFLISVDVNGDGPCDPDAPDFDGYVCWCADGPYCREA